MRRGTIRGMRPPALVIVMAASHPCPPAVLLIRHAESIHGALGLTGGWTDAGLSETGHEQARALADRLSVELAGVPVTLYSSDLLRCLETAAPVAEALGVPVVPAPALREHNNGVVAGRTLAEARARYPESFSTLWGVDTRPFPGAETWREFYTRLADFLARLPPSGPLPVLVTHGGALMNAIAWWLRMDLPTLTNCWFGAPPASVTVLRSDEWNQRGLERLGDVGHLQNGGHWHRAPLIVTDS